MAEITLTQEITQAIESIDTLLENLEDEDEIFELEEKKAELFSQLEELTVKNLSTESDECVAAAKALRTAIKNATEAREELDEAASSISEFADAINQISKALKAFA